VTPPANAEPSKWIDRPGVRNGIGRYLIGPYMRLLRATSRVVTDPPDFWQRVLDNWPVIGISWHGQSNLAYIVIPEKQRLALLISMHPDGQMMGAMARSLGYQTIDGSGASARQGTGTGGLAAFRAMLKTLKSGTSIFATADIPPEPGRTISPGMLAVARKSGRPIFAIATASSRRKVLERVWDKMQLNFPFSTVSYAMEGPFYLTSEKTDEAYAAELRASLDRVLAKAFDMADGKVVPGK
jgi:lysophospholipid acyltransferase (LPLAT)-like uncharacterized protein